MEACDEAAARVPERDGGSSSSMHGGEFYDSRGDNLL
jgi:hypothetical protein